MRCKLDENLPEAAAQWLRGAGHDVKTVREQHLGGAKDPEVARAVSAEARVLVTLDLDFSDIRAYPPTAYPGILVLRPRRQDSHPVVRLLVRVAPILETERIRGRLWVVDDAGIRVRGDA